VKTIQASHREVLSNQGHRYQTVYSPATVSILQKWFDEHKHHPYPTADEKAVLAVETGQTVVQVQFSPFSLIFFLYYLRSLCYFFVPITGVPLAQIRP
jgi:hypothetical protein